MTPTTRLGPLRNPLPVASSTTILGLWSLAGILLSVALRHWGYADEAGAALAFVGWIVHPQVGNAVVVSPDPPNEPVATVPVGEHLG